jgi:hypothetical protein
MAHECEEMELREQTAGYAFDRNLMIYNIEVGVDQVIIKLDVNGFSTKESDLRAGDSTIYDAGEMGRFEVCLIDIRDGNLLGNVPASAKFSIARV